MTEQRNLAARLRQRLTLQQQQNTADGAGGVTRSWQDLATLWAEVIPLHGREAPDAQKLTAFATHRITMRYRNDVSADKRFLLGSRALNIRTVKDIGERHRLLEILAEEGAPT